MSIAVVAEKPSVARDIAAVLCATEHRNGCFEGSGYVVTWALGHLVTLAQPHEINPEWKRWSLATLPMLPTEFPLVVVPDTKAQFAVVRRILKDSNTERVICATDAGREGELIFRYIYEAAACRKPVSRLWISSLTPDAIRKGFRNLKDASEYDRLADAAKGRSRADWLVGMNLSRAYSLSLDQEISVGRVQTPTLAIVVERELSIRNFLSEDYIEVVATFAPSEAPGNRPESTYSGTWFRAPSANDPGSVDSAKRQRLPPDGLEAASIVARARAGKATIESVQAETRKLPPPLLYDLTELQRHANRLFGMSAQKTLNLAQSLYERHKLLSYPRTDSRHLSKDIASTLGEVVRTIGGRYPGSLAAGTGTKLLGRRFVDDTRVTDHHAIIPTTTPARDGVLNADELKIYDLVCRRLLQAWHQDHNYSVTTVMTAITSPDPLPVVDRYESRGTAVEQIGWKMLDFGAGTRVPRASNRYTESPDDSDVAEQTLPAGLARGQAQRVLNAEPVAKRTRPPKHYTEATLLTAMENAGRTLEEKDLSDAMRDLGLGTPATRAQIIETLLRREYLIRRGKSLEATDKGVGLVSVVHPEVKSPAMTGEWEAKLIQLQRGHGDLAAFIVGIEAYVRDVVGRVCRTPIPAATTLAPKLPTPNSSPTAATAAIRPIESRPNTAPRTPTAPGELRKLLQSAFGFADFRPYQETVCRAAAEGRDLLLVMPTGAGKSLCYQLPGIARGGTTLVVSPLIALMEDQASKLAAQGFRAERIHSGRSRLESRQACIDYLAGRLDFLFIAPERLRVPGFPEMLAKRTPALIAVDEAHCISQWGHDFRPEYRMLGQRLPALRPAPIIALTATATPQVQDDIVAQLGLEKASRFIHGFRRTNIAIEVVELNPSERAKAVRQLLADKASRPAIVYAATRKSAEALGATLGRKLAAAYHAGMDAEARDRIQTAFLEGRLEIIVATVAFGMGIDKADVRTIIHAALPGSLEGYYQEIGRAGRDGRPASAFLLHSYTDRKTHEFFHDRDYPEAEVLESIIAKLTNKPITTDKLRRKVRMKPDLFDKYMEKLQIHGGVETTAEGEVVRGSANWKTPYLAQRDHKLEQLKLMTRFASSHDCRMVHMVRHFGDQEDSHGPCGLCDVCAPKQSSVHDLREPSPTEKAAIACILTALSRDDAQASGRLYRETFADSDVDRRSFEHLLNGLCRAGVVVVSDESFEKGGREIAYQRVSLTEAGRQQGSLLAEIALPAARRRPPSKLRTSLTKAKVTSKVKASCKAEVTSKAKAYTKPKSTSEWFFVNRAKRAKKTRRRKPLA